MTAPADAPEAEHAWERRFRLWDVYFAIGYAGVIALIALTDDPIGRRAGAIALLVALAAWYAFAGRPLVKRDIDDWRAYGYIAVMIALFVPASLLSGTSSFLGFVISPQCFMVLRVRYAVVAVLLANLAPFLTLLSGVRSPTEIIVTVLIAVLVATFATLFGMWTDWIITQSRDRAGLIERLRGSQEEIARLSRETGTMAERERLSAEIHDTLAQGFTSLLTLIQATESELDRDPAAARHHLDLAARTARENLDEARALVGALRPTALESTSLDDALARLVDRTGDETGLNAEYTSDGGMPLAPAAEVVLLRATQEALANVRRHARAGRVAVRLDRRDGRGVLTVRDDGVGFDPAAAADGYGLAGMRARVRQVGGTLDVRSSPGKGTHVTVTIGEPGRPA